MHRDALTDLFFTLIIKKYDVSFNFLGDGLNMFDNSKVVYGYLKKKKSVYSIRLS